jgi:hypothetical protein
MIEMKTQRQLIVLNHHKEEARIIKSNQEQKLNQKPQLRFNYLNEAIDK